MTLPKLLALLLAVALPPSLAWRASAASPQSGGTQSQQATPSQPTEKKKAKKVWTDDDFPQRPAQAAPQSGAPATTPSVAPGEQADKPAEPKPEEKPAPQPGSVEALEQQLARLAKDRESFEQQLLEWRAKMRAETDNERWESHRQNFLAVEEFIRRNEAETAAVQAQLQEARKKKAAKPAAKK